MFEGRFESRLEESKILYLQIDSAEPCEPTALEKAAHENFEVVDLSTLSDAEETEKINDAFLIINYPSIQSLETKETILERIRNTRTIIINGPESTQTSELLTLGHLRGFFLIDENLSTFVEGVKKISQGGFHMPEHISAQLLRYYQSVLLRHTEPSFTNLTQREIEVLQYLKEGISNNDLADQLFVSEHTVKSHLYKIFRKLRVKNRTQAIEWAHKFLP